MSYKRLLIMRNGRDPEDVYQEIEDIIKRYKYGSDG